MTKSEALSHKLKIKYGTAPHEPTDAQLALICSEINEIVQSGREPTDRDWSDVVHQHCPTSGKYSYSGIDNSDLNTLLTLAIQVAASKG